MALAPMITVAPGQKSSPVQELTSTASPIVVQKKEMENRNLKSSPSHPCLKLSFPLKRKHEVFQHQTPNPPAKISITRRPPKWEPPHSSQEKPREGRVSEWKGAREPWGKASPSHETTVLSGARIELDASRQTQQNWQSKMEEPSRESSEKVSRHTPLCKLKRALCVTEPVTSGSKSFHEANTSEPLTQSRAGCLTASLTSDSRVKDCGKLNPDEKVQMLEMAVEANVVLTMVYQDGSTQLDPEQVWRQNVCDLCSQS